MTGSQDSVTSLKSHIYRLDLEKEAYEGYFEIPDSGTREEVIGTVKHEIPAPAYEWLGINKRGFHYFILPLEHNHYELLVMSENGKVQEKRNLVMEDSEIIFKSLYLSEEGIIVGLLGFDEEVKVVWWRSDRLGEEKNRS